MKRAAARITLQAVLASLTAVAMLFVADNVTSYRHRAIVGQAHAARPPDKLPRPRRKGCTLHGAKPALAVTSPAGRHLMPGNADLERIGIKLVVRGASIRAMLMSLQGNSRCP
jgi:hypothetical protein